MSQEIKYRPAVHSSVDFARSGCRNFFSSDGGCDLCTTEYLSKNLSLDYWKLNHRVVMKEINDSRYDTEFLKVTINDYDNENIAIYYGISIILLYKTIFLLWILFDEELHLMYRYWSDDPYERPTCKLHPQSCHISRDIHTLHGLHDLLEEIKTEIIQVYS
ncbi:1734_t:CDS:2 [Diversispora eburnea]|uniref:1734_t:CDS:1 n=1 Tax=Diversispora eburnea TaxID=1213867 RepID=A0A9N9F6R3_9GLOM|nr:1734_t:CDS:2 [Diversispora eburnea]